MVNPKTKPIPIKSKPIATKSSSTSSPLSSSSSSNASPQTSSSSANNSPSIQTLIVQNSKNRGSFPRTNVAASNLHTSKSTGSVPPAAKANALAATSSATALNISTHTSSSRDGSGTIPRTSDTTGSISSAVSVYRVSSGNSTAVNGHISSDILDDLASRFIINVPDDERNNLIRICFQIELAHWFYLDFFCANDEKKCGMKQFAMSLFQHIPFLKTHLPVIDKILENWKQYKLTVPTYGAVLLSEDLRHVLLVQSFWAKSSWGFPKGKVNENEDPIHCAAREVFEETGYDITHLIVQSEYIESIINDQYTRLYLVRNVPLKTQFMPRTRKEIKCCEWFAIDSLPISKNDANTKQHLGINANSFFMIMPFVKRLKKWVNEKRSCASDRQATTTSQGSKPKFSGQYSSSIYNYNNPFLVNKKTDTKLPFKPSLASVAAGSSRTFFSQTANLASSTQKNVPGTNNSKVSSSNSKSVSSKRQRHKSMGDLDGVVRSEQSADYFHNNLKLPMNNQRRQNQTNTSSIFNDLSWPAKTAAITSSDLSEQRDKNSKPYSRRHRPANSSSKNPDMSGKTLLTKSNSISGSSDPQKPATTSTEVLEPSVSAKIASFNFDCVKKNNLDISKISKQLPSLKSNNLETNVSNNGSSSKLATKSARAATNDASLKGFSTVKGTASTRPTGEKSIDEERDAVSISEKDSSGASACNLSVAESARKTPMHLFKSIQTNPFLPLPRSSLSLMTEPAQINPSPNFDRWLDFSFTKNCIANVFC